MKRVINLDGNAEYLSEGKCIEVIPIIENAAGMPMMLPPAIWHVDNWVLGFFDDHTINSPMSFFSNQKAYIPGTISSSNHALTFLVRVLEDGDIPNGMPIAGHIDADAVRTLMQAVRIAPDVVS